MLSTAVDNNHKNWDLQLPMLMLAYRTSVHETTGATPFCLMFGRSALLPIDLEFNLPTASYNSPSQYQKQLHKQLQQAYNTVRQHTSVEHSRHKLIYDQHAHGSAYNVGDEVWLHCPAVPRGHCRKLNRPWQGPFTVVKVISTTVYRIQNNKSPRKRLVVHYNRLKPYFPPFNFNKDIFGSDQLPAQCEPESTEQSPETEEVAEPDSIPNASPTEPAAPDEQNPTPTVQTSPEPDPPLRRSSRMRQAPDRYGTVISYPDCYSSESDSSCEDAFHYEGE